MSFRQTTGIFWRLMRRLGTTGSCTLL
ncbi:hypothetical protein LINPERHAP1_LOCUS13271 [Linum perenne]